MKLLASLTAIGTAVFLIAPQAGATTLTNEDESAYRLEVILGEGAASGEELELESDETITDFCMDGCVVRLDNGQEYRFEGFENAVIRNGEFMITE